MKSYRQIKEKRLNIEREITMGINKLEIFRSDDAVFEGDFLRVDKGSTKEDPIFLYSHTEDDEGPRVTSIALEREEAIRFAFTVLNFYFGEGK